MPGSAILSPHPDDAAAAAKREAVQRYRTQVAALDAQYSVLRRPDTLRYEVVWPLP